MSMNDSQQHAMEQLRSVEAASTGSFKIESVIEGENSVDALIVKVRIACAIYPHAEGGLPLEDHEEFVLSIPPYFPFAKPDVFVLHDRFAQFPHVQWKKSLCLYQAPSTEWNPADGMFGFLDRLDLWLRMGAQGQLDPVGEPLHPPVAYVGSGKPKLVIPRVDAPVVANVPWLGTAHLREISSTRVDIVGWTGGMDDATPSCVAAAILMPDVFPYEFPANVADLITALEERSLPRQQLFLTLQWAILHNPSDSPLYVIIGTPMRGIRGGILRQHLTAWYVDRIIAEGLRTAIKKYNEDPEVKKYGEEIERIILDWAKVATVDWCTVKEERPEIVIRRDSGTAIEWFANRTVALLGCGALGGNVAEFLTRAGVKKLILHDNGIVTPGVLVRQPFDDADIGKLKVDALRERLIRIRSNVEVEVVSTNLLNAMGVSWSGIDVVIDATASTSLLALLEKNRGTSTVPVPPIITMVIGHDAYRGMIAIALPSHSGGPLDVCRKLKLEACKSQDLNDYLDEFWPMEQRKVFQPEPGCSDATFVGSAADAAGLAAVMLNLAARDLALPTPKGSATGHFVAQPLVNNERKHASFYWEPDFVSRDVHANYVVRISPDASRELRKWIDHGKETNGAKAETGGILFGERDDAASVIWVTEVSGPPNDSTASAREFVCGIEGTAEMNETKRINSRGSIHYLGMWHTHPSSAPLPSDRDFAAMYQLMVTAGGGSRTLMLIIGRPDTRPMLGTYVFKAADFVLGPSKVFFRQCVVQAFDWDA